MGMGMGEQWGGGRDGNREGMEHGRRERLGWEWEWEWE